MARFVKAYSRGRSSAATVGGSSAADIAAEIATRNATIQYRDDGVDISTKGAIEYVDFIGAGVSAAEGATGVIEVTIPGATGDVVKVGTPVNNQVGVWTGDGTIEGDADLTFDTATNTLATSLITATTVTANLTGNVTGNVSGNAATVTTNANLTGDVTSVGNATTLTNAPVIAKVLTGYVSGAGTVAATDSILQAIQKLNGNDSTNANLTGPITSVGNATAVASQTGTGSTFVMQASPTLTTPNIGTPSAGVLTNCTGLPSTGVTGLGTMAVQNANAVAITDGTATLDYVGLDDPNSAFATRIQSSALATLTANHNLDIDVQDGDRVLEMGGDLTVLAAAQIQGINNGDQTSIVGITGTMAQFDTAVSDGNIVYQSQALGTPLSGTLTNCTGLPVGGISGFGTGVATALAVNIGSAGAPLLFNGAGGTPSSMVGTNITGTAAGLTAGVASAVAVGGITGLGTGVATALAVNVGTAGAFVVNGGALGTPSSGALTNCTFPTLNQNTTGSAATLTTTRTIWGQNFNGSANVSGTLALGVSDLTLTGSIGATGARATKVWTAALESTAMPTVSGTSLSSTFSAIAGSSSIVTVGTITSGTWNGTDIAVADGGTGRSTSTTAYGLIAAGTTATGAHQTLAAGATTEILVGGGASALPVWTTATGSGSPVRATSPTLVTPILGVATATSVAAAVGTSSTNGKVGVSLFSYYTDVTTAVTTEVSAIASTIPANALATDGDRLLIEYGGIYAANANNKLIKVQFAGNNMINTGALVESGTAWRIVLTIIRDSSTSVRFSGQLSTGVHWTPVEGKITGLTLSNTNTLDLRIRTSTAAGDMTVYMGSVIWQPAS